jgi:hypothetical protein
VLVTITSTDPLAAYMLTRRGLVAALCGAAMAAAMRAGEHGGGGNEASERSSHRMHLLSGGRRWRPGTVACAPSHDTLRCSNRPGVDSCHLPSQDALRAIVVPASLPASRSPGETSLGT